MSKYKKGDKYVVEIVGESECDGFYVGNKNSDVYVPRKVMELWEPYIEQPTADDAWELMRAIWEDVPEKDLVKAFGTNVIYSIIGQKTYSEVKALYDAYQDSKRIQVGDEIKTHLETTGIVVYISDWSGTANIVTENGTFSTEISKIEKTGRHYDLSGLFEFLRGGEK